MSDDARSLLELVDGRVRRIIPPRTLGRVVGRVQAVVPSLRVVQVLLDGATTPVSAAYPALPTPPVVGDSVAVERSRDGWLMVTHVLGRDPAPLPAGVPVGAITAHGGATAPDGWLLCDGTAVSRTTFAALFAVVGVAFGAGDGTTTFNVPDLRGRFPLGVAATGTGSTLGGTGGAIDHAHTGPSHTHTVAATSGQQSVGDNRTDVPATGGNAASKPAHTHDISATSGADGTGATGTGNPPFLAVGWIIRT